jgi:hypothetical protein
MRETCARVLAAALMTGAIATVAAMSALFGTSREARRPLAAPPSTLQHSVRLVARPEPRRPRPGGELHVAQRISRPTARPVVVTRTLVIVRTPHHVRSPRRRLASVKPKATPAPAAAPAPPAADPAPVAAPAPQAAPAAPTDAERGDEQQDHGDDEDHGQGRGHGNGHEKHDD